MRGRPSLWQRTRRLGTVRGNGLTQHALQRIAEQAGIDPGELWQEAMVLEREFASLGLRTPEERLAHVAASHRIPVAELQIEIDQLLGLRP